MSREKQIEEMANAYYEAMLKARGTIGSMNEGAPKWYAKELYAKGYRKQSEGEWKSGKTMNGAWGYSCSLCGAAFVGENAEWIAKEHHYCPKCGAKMKGGVE